MLTLSRVKKEGERGREIDGESERERDIKSREITCRAIKLHSMKVKSSKIVQFSSLDLGEK